MYYEALKLRFSSSVWAYVFLYQLLHSDFQVQQTTYLLVPSLWAEMGKACLVFSGYNKNSPTL